METLSAEQGRRAQNKQHTRVSQTTCHKAFSRTGLTGTPGPHPGPRVRNRSSHLSRMTRGEGEREGGMERKREREREGG